MKIIIIKKKSPEIMFRNISILNQSSMYNSLSDANVHETKVYLIIQLSTVDAYSVNFIRS